MGGVWAEGFALDVPLQPPRPGNGTGEPGSVCGSRLWVSPGDVVEENCGHPILTGPLGREAQEGAEP